MDFAALYPSYALALRVILQHRAGCSLLLPNESSAHRSAAKIGVTLGRGFDMQLVAVNLVVPNLFGAIP